MENCFPKAMKKRELKLIQKTGKQDADNTRADKVSKVIDNSKQKETLQGNTKMHEQWCSIWHKLKDDVVDFCMKEDATERISSLMISTIKDYICKRGAEDSPRGFKTYIEGLYLDTYQTHREVRRKVGYIGKYLARLHPGNKHEYINSIKYFP